MKNLFLLAFVLMLLSVVSCKSFFEPELEPTPTPVVMTEPAATPTPTFTPTPIPLIKDAFLAEMIKSTLRVSVLTESNLQKLTNIQFSCSKSDTSKIVYSLDGIEHCTNLSFLSISYSNITDLTPLTKLQNLKTLRISGDYATRIALEDISPIASLTGLTELGIIATNIKDISPILSLTNLKTLYIGRNDIADYSTLANLNLEKLDLTGTSLTDLNFLADFTSLKYLYINETNSSDIAPIGTLTGLTEFQAGMNNISDISVLENLLNLQIVELSYNPLNAEADTVISNLRSRGCWVYNNQ